ncbi:MAG: CBS domain-containing protein [Burkholderiales bacterium]|nr:CBS domain-containing protein [Burkholderiales bacterium]
MNVHIGEICTRSVVTCTRDISALELARLMRERHVGAVIVVDERDGKPTPVGLVTDRDLVVEVMAGAVDPEIVRVGDLIVAEPVTAVDTELVFDAVWHMRSQGIRRLPVVDAQAHLVGIVTLDDVTRFLAEQLNAVTCIVPAQIGQEAVRRPS